MATVTTTTKLRPLLTSSLTTASSRCRNATCQPLQRQCYQTDTRRSHLPTQRLKQSRRRYQTTPSTISTTERTDIAFAFDIDGVLLRSSAPLPGAATALTYLHQHDIPFILLTNGGGKTEAARIADLNHKLGIDFLRAAQIIQSHTPFSQLEHLKNGTVLVCGGERNGVKRVAEAYGFENIVSPADLVVAYPDLWPFNPPFKPYYDSFAEPLPRPLYSPTGNPHLNQQQQALKIDAVFVYNDPRDWGLDCSIILDLLLSQNGYLGTVSEKNGTSGGGGGWLQDGQPHIYFSNPDLWWATSYHLSRLGQGGFQAALTGLWDRVTEGRASLDGQMTTIGKPSQGTYEFAEKRLLENLREKKSGEKKLRRVYMIGDNLESDIAGANGYQSPWDSEWKSVLVKTGVWREGMEWKDHQKPDVIKENVLEAVKWAVDDATR